MIRFYATISSNCKEKVFGHFRNCQKFWTGFEIASIFCSPNVFIVVVVVFFLYYRCQVLILLSLDYSHASSYLPTPSTQRIKRERPVRQAFARKHIYVNGILLLRKCFDWMSNAWKRLIVFADLYKQQVPPIEKKNKPSSQFNFNFALLRMLRIQRLRL